MTLYVDKRQTYLTAKLNRLGNTVIPPWAMRVYVAICKCADEHRACTVRGLARSLGITINAVWVQMRLLREAGLIQWERGHAATIRPLYRLTMFVEAK